MRLGICVFLVYNGDGRVLCFFFYLLVVYFRG